MCHRALKPMVLWCMKLHVWRQVGKGDKIAHSTVTGLPPLLEKVCYSCLVVHRKLTWKGNVQKKIRGALTVLEKDSKRLYDRA